MAWRELQLVGLPRTHLDAASAALFAAGAAGLQEDHLPGEAPPPRQPWDTGPPPPPTARLVLRAWFEDPDAAAVEHALPALPVELRWADVEDQDWSETWKRGFDPIHVSDRLVVTPPWESMPGALIIEPGQGFGTGHHPTTRQALQALDALADECRTALDVGCGSGVLALAAAKLGLVARGTDIDEPSVRDAARNAAANALSAVFDTTPVHRLTEPADLVLANLHAELLTQLADELVRLTGRWLVVAGVLADREPAVRDALAALTVERRVQDDAWVCLWLRRP